MIVFLWDACEPGRFHGVTDDETRARQAAEARLLDGRASTAQVEMAHAVLGITTLTSGYRRTGNGWQAQRGGARSGITWEPFAAAQD